MPDFDEFVAAHVDDLLRTAYLIVWDEAEAEDLVQECLMKLARRWPRVSRMEHSRAYSRRVLVNLALDGARGRARRRSELELVAERGPERRRNGLEPGVAASATADDPLPLIDTRAELIDALGRLPVRQRAVLVLRYFNDLTEAQVAEVLGCSPGTVKSSASRGLARLREALKPVPLEPRSTKA